MFSWSDAMRCTFGRLRRLSSATVSSRSTTASTRVPSVTVLTTDSTSERAAFVDGVSPATIEETTYTLPARARSDSAPRRAAAFIFFGVRWL